MDGWIVALWLIIFFPVGLYLTWTRSDWERSTKWLVTALALIPLFAWASGVWYVHQSWLSNPYYR